MAILNDLIVTGQSRLLNKLYCSSGIDATGNISISNGGLVIRGTYDNLSTCGQLTLFNSSGSGFIVRNDINYTYFLITKSNTDLSFNSLRPMHINMSSGLVSFNHGISVTNVSAGTATFSGKTTHNGGITVSGTASVTSLTASTGLFTNCQVLDTLRTTKWELDSISTLGGHFMVAPTIFFSSSTTATISAISGTTVTMAIKDSNSIKSNSAGGATWSSGAKVKLSGRLGNVALGTCTGTLTTAMNATAGTITLTFTFDNASSLSVKSYAASEIHNLAIMMYNNGTYPVGIAMTSYGTNGYSYIDVYAGSSSANNPNVRIGNLQGLPALSIDGNSTTFSPQGYGVYTDNGYFKGRILANAGIIGGFTLSSNSIQSGTFGTSGSVMMCTGSNTAKSIANSAATVSGWCFTAGTKFGVTNQGVVYCSDIKATGGTIGRYTITSTYIYTGEGSNQVGIGGNQAFWAGGTASDSAPFRVSYAGALVTTNITATGGTIGGCSISNGKLTVPAANISGILTASQIQVGLGGNLYPNYDTFTNITSSTISYLKNSTATVSLDTSVTYYGKKSLKIVSSGTDSYVYLGHSSNNYGCIKVIANKVYRISCYAASTSSANCELYVVGHTAINSTNSAHSVTSATVGTLWTRIEFSYTASSSYPYISLRVDVNTNGATVYFDAFQIEEVSSTSQIASPFKPSGSTMIDGGNIYADTITATQLNVSSLSAISANLGAVTAGQINIGNGKFQVATDGTLTCTGAKITGDVTATAFKINNTSISVTQPSLAMTYWTWSGNEIIQNVEYMNSVYSNALTLTSTHVYTNGNIWADKAIYSPRISATSVSCADLYAPEVSCSYANVSNEIIAGSIISNGTISSTGAMSVGTSLSVGSTFHIAATNAVDLSNSSAAFVLGTKDGQHIEMDDNRIQAKANATTDRAIHLNPFGGNLHVNYNYGETNGGRLAFGSSGGASVIASNSNILIKGSKFSASYPGSITLRSAGYWKSSSDYLNGTVQLQDANTNTWIHLAYDATKPYFASKAIYNRTTSSGSAVHIDSSGLLLRYSSASKYKTDIEPITDGSYAYNVLKINPKTWYDKSEIESYANALTKEIEGKNPTEVYANYNHVSLERVHGLVAEDVEAAGLGKYCIYEVDAEKNTKELEGINYEKVTTLLIPIVRDLVLYTQKTAKYIHAEEITDDDRGEIATLLSRINSFREEEVIA